MICELQLTKSHLIWVHEVTACNDLSVHHYQYPFHEIRAVISINDILFVAM